MGIGAGIVKNYNDSIFILFFWYIWGYIPGLEIPVILKASIWISTVVRIVICMFPLKLTGVQWRKYEIINQFAVTGIGVIILYLTKEAYLWISASKDGCSDNYCFLAAIFHDAFCVKQTRLVINIICELFLMGLQLFILTNQSSPLRRSVMMSETT